MKLFFSFITIILLFQCNQPKRQSETNQASFAAATEISIVGENFYINGQPTLQGVIWNEINMEGLLPNSRMVQGIFDDENPETTGKWIYPDTKAWSADRNTDEFIAAMEQWHRHGLLAFTICLQGGSPEGYSKSQPWENNAFNPDGSLRLAYMNRLERILKKADELGMVAIVGLFYFGQDQRLADDEAVRNATNNAINWLLDSGHKNILIEIANECNNNAYDQEIIKAPNIHELILQAKSLNREGRRLLVSTSYNGNTLPTSNVVEVSDFILIHGNGVKLPERMTEMVNQVRSMPEYKPMPIVFNEDDHFDFEKPINNMTAAFAAHASWGYFDFRMEGEAFEDGYQSVPVDWGINSERKRAFFEKLKEITGN